MFLYFTATKVARNSVKCDLGIEYFEPGGPKLDIYYPQPNSGGKYILRDY